MGWDKISSGSITDDCQSTLNARKDNMQLPHDSSFDKAVMMKMHMMRMN